MRKQKVRVQSLLKDGKLTKGYKLLPLPEKTVILRCGIDQRYCPGVNEAEPSRTYYYLFKFDPENKENPVPEMTGKDLNADGTRQDFDTAVESANRDDAVHRQGRGQVPRRHPACLPSKGGSMRTG